ncbi:hypothetical protein E2562_036130 [Oryza meyeriana var. granulata]|uniref:Uncharacterized protein n=1 Tax=Oryza meyeriana var. granulata TaxID=110450 RepID=A0A6G1E7U1_9ORYZ|nr:hypothetical protein E2562_036130 [Oryza meyeriana var. granulata]
MNWRGRLRGSTGGENCTAGAAAAEGAITGRGWEDEMGEGPQLVRLGTLGLARAQLTEGDEQASSGAGDFPAGQRKRGNEVPEKEEERGR